MTFLQQTHQAHRERSIRLGRIPAPRRAEPEPVTPEPVKQEPVVVQIEEHDEPGRVPVTAIWPHLAIRKIATRVAEHYGITYKAIIRPVRTSRVVRPRHVAMYLAKKLTARSLPEIGRRFGGRDHTTVLNAIWRTERRMATDPVLRAEVIALECELRAAMAKPVEAA